MPIIYKYIQPNLFDEMNPLEELAYLEEQGTQIAELNQFENTQDFYKRNVPEKTNMTLDWPGNISEISREELAKLSPCMSPARSIKGDFAAMVISGQSNCVSFSGEVMETLNFPKGVVVSFSSGEIAIATGIPGNHNYFNVHSISNGKYCIYSTSLGQEIRNVYSLFTGGEVPYAFRKKRFVKCGEEIICLIEVPKEASIVGEQMKSEVDVSHEMQ
ncbi:hypothetical protein [Planomicrobium okeanokoites]|uniref:hypothetical protein n=1 Tax=Planomicrobium okeanokoites TaxID=244 RepID=UPI0030F6F7CD